MCNCQKKIKIKGDIAAIFRIYALNMYVQNKDVGMEAMNLRAGRGRSSRGRITAEKSIPTGAAFTMFFYHAAAIERSFLCAEKAAKTKYKFMPVYKNLHGWHPEKD